MSAAHHPAQQANAAIRATIGVVALSGFRLYDAMFNAWHRALNFGPVQMKQFIATHPTLQRVLHFAYASFALQSVTKIARRAVRLSCVWFHPTQLQSESISQESRTRHRSCRKRCRNRTWSDCRANANRPDPHLPTM